ncbi:MAG: hypothetical protein IJ598_02600 [Ruminococcus sp.]|nr:hypothetical protein [Ruminococcus sp.]
MKSNDKMYKVDYCGEKFAYRNAKDTYAAGERVELYYFMLATDTDYSFSLEGAALSLDYHASRGYILRFTMPDHDVVLRCRKRNTMLRQIPDEEV